MNVLAREFYRRDAVRLARALLGKIVVHETREGVVAGRIVETEAYRGPADRAAHSYGGRRTARNEVMYGPPGHAYVYFIYGMHWCLNVVAAETDVPEAVLLRALEPIEGIDVMRARRGVATRDEHLLRGPGNLCRALGVTREQNGHDFAASPLFIADASPIPASQIARTPRIGVDYAGADAARPWRFIIGASPSVSGKNLVRRVGK
ncbi:MAG: DNA-3-methyladenine glycosylase [Planctomycetes bacterium]|nr:DNA-3-methyladenine glycosylase [Planctomycetota bacterium]MBI3844911.1 DNA-3-methyladenine glycosylase [Planctomycetota bacterium]